MDDSILPVKEIEARLKELNPNGVPAYGVDGVVLWAQRKMADYKFRERHPYKTRDIKFRLRNRMSSNIRHSLDTKKNGRHWETLVGYTVKNLIKHIEKQFTNGMTWANYGEWHIDHIIPIRGFHFTSPDDIDFKRYWALSNLQPLWAKDNLSKASKLLKPFQPTLT